MYFQRIIKSHLLKVEIRWSKWMRFIDNELNIWSDDLQHNTKSIAIKKFFVIFCFREFYSENFELYTYMHCEIKKNSSFLHCEIYTVDKDL